VEITISIPGGTVLAEKTMNGRLGILGGLSILGTTGVVTPYSCAAWISAIHRGVDVALASGQTHIAACTGSTSEKSLQGLLNLPEFALIDMGDFVGGLLKYLKRYPVERLTIGGGFAKLVKLAQGAGNLHSKESRVDFVCLAAWLLEAGGSEAMAAKAKGANTAMEVLEIAQAGEIPLGDLVAHLAAQQARDRVTAQTAVEIQVFDRRGERVGHAGF
jgi:cobalt-precorrin-5B (C1)-methyltransferase